MNILKKIVEWFEENKKVSFTFSIIALITMTYFSSIPRNTLNFKSIWPSVIYHFSIFAGFAFFFLATIAKEKIKTKKVLTTIFVSLIVSILDEVHQIFVPLRSPSILDIFVDMTGVLFSIVIYVLIKKSK